MLIPGLPKNIVAKHIVLTALEPTIIVMPTLAQYINYDVFLTDLMVLLCTVLIDTWELKRFGAFIKAWEKCTTHSHWLILIWALLITIDSLD
jgi:hypothetical protein